MCARPAVIGKGAIGKGAIGKGGSPIPSLAPSCHARSAPAQECYVSSRRSARRLRTPWATPSSMGWRCRRRSWSRQSRWTRRRSISSIRRSNCRRCDGCNGRNGALTTAGGGGWLQPFASGPTTNPPHLLGNPPPPSLFPLPCSAVEGLSLPPQPTRPRRAHALVSSARLTRLDAPPLHASRQAYRV